MAGQATDQRPPSFAIEPDSATTATSRASIGPATDLSVFFKIAEQAAGAVRAELMGEIRALTAAMRENEAQRSLDVQQLKHALEDTPKLSAIKHENRVAIAWAVGIALALIIGLWTVFGVGASTTSGFADHVLGVKQEQKIEQQRYDQLNTKIDQVLRERGDGRENGNAVQPTAKGNAVGNGT